MYEEQKTSEVKAAGYIILVEKKENLYDEK